MMNNLRLLQNILKNNKYSFTHGKRAWFKQHINDEFVKKAIQLNYRSRAAFKLQQIQQKYHILGDRIIDLGAAPGSWSQFTIRYKQNQKVKHSSTLSYPLQKPQQGEQQKKQSSFVEKGAKIVAVDILQMKPLDGVDFYKCDARSLALHKSLLQRYGHFDTIISDMAPNFSGVGFETHEQILKLNKMCVSLCYRLSNHQCNLVMKTIEGSYSKPFFELLEIVFEKVHRFKPKASKSESTQFYLIGQKLKKRYLKPQEKIKMMSFLSEYQYILFGQNLNKKQLQQRVDEHMQTINPK